MNTAITKCSGNYYNSAGQNYNRINDVLAESEKKRETAKQNASNEYYRNLRLEKNNAAKQRSAVDARTQAQANDRITKMKRMIRGEEKQKYGVGSILESLQTYTDQLKASRETSKKTNTELKQLRYNFKDISGQIRRSKTSANAKQVVNKARREVVMLKLKQQSGQYDEEEISAAITHAEAMERAAKKKAKHLMEEEMIKITDDAPSQRDAINMEEQIEAERDKALEELDKEMQALEEQLDDLSEEEMQEMQEAMEQSQQEMQEMTEESMEEMSEQMFDEMGEAMQEMMEDTFSELADSMFTVVDFEMTEDDFKELVKRHRTSEEKDMVKADMEYLKAMFDRYNRMLNDAKTGGSVSPQAPMADMSGISSGMQVSGVSAEVSIPQGSMVDISV